MQNTREGFQEGRTIYRRSVSGRVHLKIGAPVLTESLTYHSVVPLVRGEI